MAKQNPPLHNIPPNRVVDMIPRLPPPRLEGGNWSNPLREFVALCLNEVPEERATVDELLRSKFVKASKGYPSSLMRELIARYEQWAQRGGVRDSMWQATLQSDMDQLNATLAAEPGWDFDTVKSRLSGVSEYIAKEMGSNASTLKASYRSPPISEAARQRAAEGLVRLFQSPEDEAAAAAQGAKMGSYNPMDSRSDLSFRSSASSRSTTPENKVAMISIPSFDDHGLRVPEKRSGSPHSGMQIVMPSEDEAWRMAQAKAAAAAPRSTPTPPLLDKDRAPMVRIRRNRADSAGASVLRPNGLSSSPTPPPHVDAPPSPRRPSTAASAPSSPPRVQYTSNPLLANGLKSHHLPSKSAPNIAALRDGAPPLPVINNPPPQGRLPSVTSAPHTKSRSQDITRKLPGKMGANKPSNLNLDLPPGAGSGGVLPPSPSRPFHTGFPVIEPLDVGVLPLDGGDPRMLDELDRVLAGLGDALEVMQVGLKGMRRWREREKEGREEGEEES